MPYSLYLSELESALNSFRNALRDSWTRRAIRMLTISRPAALLTSLSLSDVTSWRDNEWEAREKSYHDTALAEINSLVRKYNAMAPYAVRRTVYSLEAELNKVYQESGEDILQGISERVNSSPSATVGPVTDFNDDRVGSGGAAVGGLGPVRIRDLIRQWVASVKAR